MATYDDPDDGDYGSLPIGEQQEFLYDQIGFHGEARDDFAHDLFWEVMYNDELSQHQRMELYDALSEYLEGQYGIDFAEVWDWEDFRSWYESV
jgi:hypothetical protein